MFRFPFDHNEKSDDASRSEIEGRLKDLGIRTLLFLKNIELIEYAIGDTESGAFRRQTTNVFQPDFAESIELIGQHELSDDQQERWLVFKRNVTHLVENYNLDLFVEIGFLWRDSTSDEIPIVEPLLESDLIVFFPTELETHLGFLVQGPYRTTSTRDDVPDCDFNSALAVETGELVVDTLRWLRDRNWLTIDFLETMPLAYKERRLYSSYLIEHNPYEDSLFEPIYDLVLTAIQTEKLIPAHEGGHVAGYSALLAGRDALRDLLGKSQLPQLFDSDDSVQWVSREITESATRNLWRYLSQFVGADSFVEHLSEVFLSEQTDS